MVAVQNPPDTQTEKANAPIGLGDPESCGPCDWFGKPGVRDNDEGHDPTGPLTEDQRCSGCKELVCNRHDRFQDLPTDHFVSDHGEPYD